MKIHSNSFSHDGVIPGEFAFGIIDPINHVALSTNRNPHLAWHDVPANTRSFALICHDPDVPSRGDDVNQEGRSVPASLPRVDFFHWVLVDIPATLSVIGAGVFSSAVSPRGKPGPVIPDGPHAGLRQGMNDYTGWFAGDDSMRGDYYGYDGPCPPWNDEIIHRYVFTIYALDVTALTLPTRFTGGDVRHVMSGHVLAEASLTGRYSLNPTIAL